ncbi:MAG: hypothetical protein EZS28_034367 [Streblomastix strix]|uniref:Protein kinase domain-containing protein n=1 Tax=Streblomastix strix TaxID=222440 RepID=A0A5J4UI45_9EUKA|nr:MAG: hypothetical protein EZS28_034367 [Streblomastix strix]
MKLGDGHFGDVFLVYNEQFGVIAAKLIQNGKFNAREWEAASQVNRGEQNPFVVKSLLAQKQDEYVIVLQEYSNMGDMENFIQKMPVLPISTIRAIMKQILLGLRLLHEKGIVHRDIKEPNILLHSPPGSGRVIFKIGDLGIVKILKNVNKETLMTKIGTAIFMAPEVEIGDRIADGKV